MAHIAKMSVPTADAKAIQNITGGGVPTENAPPIIGIIKTPINNIIQPRTNKVQAFIVAKALNMSGIFLPPVNSMLRVYNVIAFCQYRQPFRNKLNGFNLRNYISERGL